MFKNRNNKNVRVRHEYLYRGIDSRLKKEDTRRRGLIFRDLLLITESSGSQRQILRKRNSDLIYFLVDVSRDVLNARNDPSTIPDGIAAAS